MKTSKEERKLILAILACSFALILLLFAAADLMSKRKLNFQKVYIASHDIAPRSQIEEKDLIEISYPTGYLPEYVVLEKDEILGKYTEIQGMIPAGSWFYKSMLHDASSMPDYPQTQLLKGQAAYALEVDIARLGGTLTAGQRVDLHVNMKSEGNEPLCGCLFENVRILAIKDHKGLDITDKKSSKMPHLAMLAIGKDDVAYLSKANEVGSVRLIATDKTYEDKEAVLKKDSAIFLELAGA